MLAKWLFFTFIGLSSLFVTDLRADDTKSDALKKLQEKANSVVVENDENTADGKTSATRAGQDAVLLNAVMQKNREEIEKATGLKIEIDKYMLEDYEGSIGRTLKRVNTPKILELLSGIVGECSMKEKIGRLKFDTEHMFSVNTVYLSIEDAKLEKTLVAKLALCKELKSLANDIGKSLGKRSFAIAVDRVYSKSFSITPIRDLAKPANLEKFSASLEKLETSCKVQFKKVAVESYSRFEPRNGEINIVGGNSLKTTMKRLAETILVCENYIPKLAKLNETVGLPSYMLFMIDLEDVYGGEITAAKLGAWIKYLSTKSNTLKLRKVALSSPDGKDFYKDVRACLADKDAACDPTKIKIIGIELTTYTGFPSYTGFSMMFFMLSPVISLAMIATDSLDEKIIRLDISRGLRLPKAIED